MVLEKYQFGITIKYAVSASSKYFALLPDVSCVPLAFLDDLLYCPYNTTVKFNTLRLQISALLYGHQNN